jgi:branched-subunit amino acid transport protein AzlD
MSAFISLVAASVLTLALRVGPSLLGNGVTMPAALQRANRFAAPALMGALASRGAANAVATGGLPVVVAVTVATPIALRSRSVVATLAAGTIAHLVAVAVMG